MIKEISEKMKIAVYRKIRFFNVTGVEIYPEDFIYIKNGDILYVSKGKQILKAY